jgi:hypothetical protein
MAEHVSPRHFGGFVTTDRETSTETLFAIDRDTGRILCRVAPLGTPHFDGANWQECEAVPAWAEWIGNYPAPCARQELTHLSADAASRITTTETGTRIRLSGRIGGWQE